MLWLQKNKLLQTLSNISCFGVTTNGWTHGQTNSKYITVTVQYIDKSFVTRSCILSMVTLEEKNIAVCIKNCVIDILSKHEANRASYVFVTDNAVNMKAAFRNYIWIGCFCHNLNLVLSNG